MQTPTAQPRQDASAMKGLIEIVTSLVSFDVVLLRERLATLDDRRTRVVLILFTVLADSIRFFLVTCLFVLALY